MPQQQVIIGDMLKALATQMAHEAALTSIRESGLNGEEMAERYWYVFITTRDDLYMMFKGEAEDES